MIGVASKAAEEVRLGPARAAGVPVRRRFSGGAAVLLSPEVVCFGMVFPYADYDKAGTPVDTIRGAYRVAASLVAKALAGLGVEVAFEPPGDLAVGGKRRQEPKNGTTSWNRRCTQMDADRTNARNGLAHQATLRRSSACIGVHRRLLHRFPRKIAGFAQARRRRAALVHGVLPISLDGAELERLLGRPPEEPAYRRGRSHSEFVTDLRTELGSCEVAEAESALARALAGVDAVEEDFTPEEIGRARALVEGKYSLDEWNLRR